MTEQVNENIESEVIDTEQDIHVESDEQSTQDEIVEQGASDEHNDTVDADNAESEEDSQEDDEPKGVSKRIGKLTAKYKTVQEENEKLRKQLEGKSTVGDSDRPNKDDFASQEDYEDALIDYRAEKRAAQKYQVAEAQSFVKKAEIVKEIGAEKYEDYNDVVLNSKHDIFYNKEFVNAIIDSDSAADVAYHLAKNPTEADRLMLMPRHRALAELGKLEARLSTSQKRKSKAPEPLGSLKTSSSPGKQTKKPDDMNLEEYKAWRSSRKKR